MQTRSLKGSAAAPVGAGLVILVLALGFGVPAQAETGPGAKDGPAAVPERVSPDAARVGEHSITYEDLLKRAAKQPRFLTKLGTAQGKAEVLRPLITARLLELAAGEEDLLQGDGSHDWAAVLAELERRHYPLPESVPENLVRGYYDANRPEFGIPSMVRVTRIQFTAPEAGPEREAAQARAQAVLVSLREGADPADLDLGPDATAFTPPKFFPLDVVPWFPEALEAVDVGQYTEVVATDTGFEIVKLLKRQPELVAPYDEVREGIAMSMKRSAQIARRNAYLGELAQRYGAEVADPAVAAFIPFIPDENDGKE